MVATSRTKEKVCFTGEGTQQACTCTVSPQVSEKKGFAADFKAHQKWGNTIRQHNAGASSSETARDSPDHAAFLLPAREEGQDSQGLMASRGRTGGPAFQITGG